jgi:enoyl-CoA hydratase/carnithine racemase
VNYRHVTQVREGDAAILTLNRPERRNALSLDLMLELISCLDGIAA